MRYFLHIEDGVSRIEDKEGSELPTLEEARCEALAAARQLWAAAIVEVRDVSMYRFVVTDSEGKVLTQLGFVEALPARLRERLSEE
ncbi:MAG: hypothetical protein EOP12_03385 [Pseudomonas sp.]|nr:MAG: hypothetical protein EOP12_03385 [Pseudomonas sp.]